MSLDKRSDFATTGILTPVGIAITGNS